MPKIICLLNDVFNIKTRSLREEKSIEHCDIGFSNITVVYIKELEYFLCFTEIKEKKRNYTALSYMIFYLNFSAIRSCIF